MLSRCLLCRSTRSVCENTLGVGMHEADVGIVFAEAGVSVGCDLHDYNGVVETEWMVFLAGLGKLGPRRVYVWRSAKKQEVLDRMEMNKCLRVHLDSFPLSVQGMREATVFVEEKVKGFC